MDLHLNKLTLRLAGLSASDGRRLAELVCHRIAAIAPAAVDGGAATVGISMAARPGESLDALAQRIVAELLVSLTRTVS